MHKGSTKRMNRNRKNKSKEIMANNLTKFDEKHKLTPRSSINSSTTVQRNAHSEK